MATTDIYHISGSAQGRKAVAFLGGATDDFVQVDAFAAARVAANDTAGTFTAWVNVPDLVGTAYTIIGCGDDNVVEFIELNVENGKVVARCTDATTAAWVLTTDAIVIKPHRWQHIALVQNAAYPVLYVDGVKVAQTLSTSTAPTKWFDDCAGIDKGDIGAANKTGDGADTQEFKGGISDVKYWKVALTADQVVADRDGQAPSSLYSSATTDLISWWDFDDDFIDSVAAHNGTNTGDNILTNNYSEFTSRLRYFTGSPVVADKVLIAFDQGVGHAVVIQAA